MAMKFAPLAIQFSTGVLPGRLYHASLLKSHALGGMALTWVPATSEPDFVAFDFLGRVHLIESKGNMGALDYGGLGKGINQVRNLNNFVVGGVNVFPTTRTACATYTKRCAALVGTCGREVRGCVVEVPCAHAGGQNVVPPDHPLRRRLAGLYALGAFASLDALSNQEPEDAGPWQIYSVPPVPDLDGEEGQMPPIRIGIWSALYNLIANHPWGPQPGLPPPNFDDWIEMVGLNVLDLDNQFQLEAPARPEGMQTLLNDQWMCIQ